MRFGIAGGFATGLFVPLFLQTMNLLSGVGLVPWSLVLDDAIWATVFGGVAAGGSLSLAQRVEHENTMALVVLLRGVNVGGHKTFRPSALAESLSHLDVVNIGAAGTFVVRQPVTRTELRDELTRRLPFTAEVIICQGREIVRLTSQNPFARQPVGPSIVHFVSVLSQRPRSEPPIPLSLPSKGRWLLRILARKDRFVLGLYRRHMKVIGYLGTVDRLFGVPVTTRNWNTVIAIARVLDQRAT